MFCVNFQVLGQEDKRFFIIFFVFVLSLAEVGRAAWWSPQ